MSTERGPAIHPCVGLACEQARLESDHGWRGRQGTGCSAPTLYSEAVNKGAFPNYCGTTRWKPWFAMSIPQWGGGGVNLNDWCIIVSSYLHVLYFNAYLLTLQWSFIAAVWPTPKLICQEKGAFQKCSSTRRILKTLAFSFRVDEKHFEKHPEKGTFLRRCSRN